MSKDNLRFFHETSRQRAERWGAGHPERLEGKLPGLLIVSLGERQMESTITLADDSRMPRGRPWGYGKSTGTRPRNWWSTQ